MKIVLRKDVKGLGKTHDIVETSDGYALNFLIPQKAAVPATSTATEEALVRQKQAVGQAEVDVALLQQNITALSEARIVIRMKANEKGHLYDAVGEPEILRAVKDQTRIDIARGAIALEKPLKELGTFDIPVSTAHTFGKFSVTIEAE